MLLPSTDKNTYNLDNICGDHHLPINHAEKMCMLHAFFWVITRRLEFICRCFGTLCLFHLHRQVDVSRMN